MKALIAMSGGVDSAVAALLTKKAGYDCHGITLRLCPEDDGSAAEEAETLCRALGIPHETADLRDAFRKEVIDRFISGYEFGDTPNPCVLCNRHFKFGYLLRHAEEGGYDKLVTGHYARIDRERLLKAKDPSKDQSYVLYMLKESVLPRLLFPLGDYTKPQVREIAAAHGFPNASRGDSQDICFVPDGDYAGFIRHRTGKCYPAGDFVDKDGRVLGRHRGLIGYTVGQRRGLALSLPAPLYVLEKDVAANRVILGENEDLFRTAVYAKDGTFVKEMPSRFSCSARVRYRQKESPAIVETGEGGKFTVRFSEPQRAPANGQAIVLYRGDEVLGGGTICGSD